MPSAASAPNSFSIAIGGGRTSSMFATIKIPAAASAKVAANMTTRRDAENAASSGTTTSQIAAYEPMPPVNHATAATNTAIDSAEKMWAASKRPVRDRKYEIMIGATSQA